MSKINVAVVGVGSFGAVHLDAYRTVPDVEVVAVCDTCQDRLHEIAAKYGIKDAYTDCRELCARDDLHIVSIATPEASHVEPVLAAAASGKHILLEKPLATNLHDAHQILDATHQAGVFLMVGHVLRFENHYASAKRLIDEGRLGRIVSIHARRNRPRSLYKIYGQRAHGLLVNAIHDIDACLWYVADRVVRARAITRNVQQGTFPDVNWGMLEFEQGAVACLESHWMIPDQAGVGTDDRMQVIGTEGVANVQALPAGLDLWTADGACSENVDYEARFHGTIHGAIREEIAYFVDCVRANRAPTAITPTEALTALKVSLALIQSAEEGRDVSL